MRKERKESRKSEERTRNRHGSNDENQKENHKSERAEEEISSRRNEDDSEVFSIDNLRSLKFDFKKFILKGKFESKTTIFG